MNVQTEQDGCLLSGHILHLAKTTWFILVKVRKVNSKEHCITSKLNSNLLKSENISDFDLKYTNENLRILYGLINGTAYISFDIFWIRIQFRSNLDNTFIRTVYGDSPIEEWTQIK